MDAGANTRVAPVALPFRHLVLKRARCAIPDGGARVTAFDSATVSDADCERWPLMCATPTSRADVLRHLDAGTLEFPVPQHTALTDGLGWFEVPLEASGLVMIECADTTLFYAPPHYEQDFADPTLELFPPSLPFQPESGERVLLINPWTRQTSVVDRAALSSQPPALLARTWATTLDGPPLTKSPMSSAFLDGKVHTFANIFSREELPPPPPLENPVSVTVRAVVGAPLPLRELHLEMVSADGDTFEEVDTRQTQHVFQVVAGAGVVRVKMPGATPVERAVDAGADVELLVTLAPAIGAWGRVVDAKGLAIDGADVVADGEVVTRTDARGEFALSAPPRRLHAWHAEVGASDELTPGRVGEVKLVLKRRADARVRFEAPDGGAVWGLARLGDVRTSPRESVLIRHSELVLDGLAPGPHLLTVLTRDWRAAQVKLVIGDAPVRLVHRLEEKPALSGTVLKDGQPAVGVKLGFLNPPAVWGYEEDTAVTDAQGRFRLTRSLPGAARLKAGRATQKVKVPAVEVRIELAR